MSVNQRCSHFRVSVNQRFHCICQFSFLLCLGWRSVQFFQNDFFTCLCRSQNSFVFLIRCIVSERKLEKSHTILHISGQNCSLATRSHAQFHYIYKIPNTCLLLPNHSEMRSRKSRQLFNPSSQQSYNVAPAIFKNFQRYKEKLLSLSVNKFMFFYFLQELRIVCQVITQCPRVSCLPDGIDHEEGPHCHQNYREDKRPLGMRLRIK